jgi:PadR family transcriptional regulator PadR
VPAPVRRPGIGNLELPGTGIGSGTCVICSPNANIFMKSATLAELEELTLLIVVALGLDAYGVSVQSRLERDARRPVALGAVYAALDRLERKGYVTSQFGEATKQRGGRRKRMFVATPAGVRALRDSRRTRERLWRAIEAPEGPRR